MPAPLTPLDDPSPLDGDRVQVAPRIAWLLRMARLGGDPTLSQAAVGAALRAEGVRTHARLMSEVENGKVRSGRIVAGYERALGLAPGRLRAPVDLLCRSTPGAPPDRDQVRPESEPLSVEALSALGERVQRSGRSGGDWLAWARALASPEARGFPAWLAGEWLDQLLDELGRSVGTAYATRLEALALLRCSAYGDLVLDAAQRAVAEPGAQVVLDVVDAVTHAADGALLRWGAALLDDARPLALRGGAQLLARAAARGGPSEQDWDSVVDPVLAACQGALARQSEARGSLLDGVVASLPQRQADAVRQRLDTPPGPPPRPRPLGSATAANPRWRRACDLADQVADPLGLPDRAMLARLLFELLFEHREERTTAAAALLVAVPFTDRVFEAILEHALSEVSGPERARVLWRLVELAPPAGTGDLSALLGPELAAVRAVLLAHAGRCVDCEVLDDLLERPEHRRRALYAAGLVEDPWLDKVAQDDAQPAPVREAARWWQGRGGLVSD